MGIISYAQNFEDVLLHRVFGGQETGFYVDVGAFHPVIGSVTKAFYDKGWRGINIEPGSVFSDLAAARPGDINLCMAVFDRAGEIPYVEDEADRGTSRVVMEGGHETATRMVPCDTLQAIVDAHAHGRPVDFIKIDAEGAEAAIVHSTDWRRLRPHVLLIEATRPWSSLLANQDWEPTLLQQGYVRAYFDGINCFYIPEEETATLLRHFQVPVNVLDRAERYEDKAAHAQLHIREVEAAGLVAERDALRVRLDAANLETAGLTAERDGLQAALDDHRGELARLIESHEAEFTRMKASQDAEFGRLKASYDADLGRFTASYEAELGRLTASHDAVLGQLTASSDAARAESAQLAAERDALQRALDSHQVEVTRLALERDAARIALEAKLAEEVTPAEAPVAEHTPLPTPAPAPPRLRRRLVRRTAKVVYRLVRPVVRPAVWRLRGFMIGEIIERLGLLDQRVVEIAAAPPQQNSMVVAPNILPPSVIQIRDDGAAAEMRRLAVEMERTLLTLALEKAPEPTRAAPTDQSDNPVASPESARVALLLPHGRGMEVACRLGDLSVAAVLAASGGDWEPHVRRYLESIVQPEWVCMDIGANLGAHTLSLAVLAQDGEILAFEADAHNFALLSHNVAALAAPHGKTAPVNLALWDSPGTLLFGGADELAGCSFVSEDLASEAVERNLRRVVDADAINGVEMHIRSGRVAALPLDDWAERRFLPRLDLIKLDVEGAERHVLRGADATLRRHRPILLVEYNPSCAAAYFGQPANALFEELKARFAAIHVLEPDSSLTPVPDWPALEDRLAAGKGWEDLVCHPEKLPAD